MAGDQQSNQVNGKPHSTHNSCQRLFFGGDAGTCRCCARPSSRMPVKDIATKLEVSEPRVYQLIARGKAIGKQYREDNE